MTPKQHYEWTKQVSAGCVEIEILELVKLAPNGKKIIVDTKNLAEDLGLSSCGNPTLRSAGYHLEKIL